MRGALLESLLRLRRQAHAATAAADGAARCTAHRLTTAAQSAGLARMERLGPR